MLLVTVVILVLVAKEAHVSQVDIHETAAVPLKEYINNRLSEHEHVLLVKGLYGEIFTEIKFPESTHYLKEQETIYQELVGKYQVESVIRSDKFKEKDIFWVWEPPNYSLADVERYHKEGLSQSPVIIKAKTNYPIEGDRFIVFMTESIHKNQKYPVTYEIEAREGEGALEEINKALGKKHKNGGKHGNDMK